MSFSSPLDHSIEISGGGGHNGESTLRTENRTYHTCEHKACMFYVLTSFKLNFQVQGFTFGLKLWYAGMRF